MQPYPPSGRAIEMPLGEILVDMPHDLLHAVHQLMREAERMRWSILFLRHLLISAQP